MAFIGMDVEACNAHATSLNSQTTNVQDVINSIESLIGQLVNDWKGQDSNNFHNDWNSTHKPNLTNIHQALTQFHTTLTQNIQAQSDVSNA